MRWWSWLALGVVACGGDGGTDGDGNGTDGGGTDGGGDVDLACDEVRDYNVDELDCDETWNALLEAASDALKCNRDSDCVLERLNCESWVQATCYIVVNTCVEDIRPGTDPEVPYLDLEKYKTAGTGCMGDDSGDQCSCPGSPDYGCRDHTCQFLYE